MRCRYCDKVVRFDAVEKSTGMKNSFFMGAGISWLDVYGERASGNITLKDNEQANLLNYSL